MAVERQFYLAFDLMAKNKKNPLIGIKSDTQADDKYFHPSYGYVSIYI
jgi:hypothetical protein